MCSILILSQTVHTSYKGNSQATHIHHGGKEKARSYKQMKMHPVGCYSIVREQMIINQDLA